MTYRYIVQKHACTFCNNNAVDITSQRRQTIVDTRLHSLLPYCHLVSHFEYKRFLCCLFSATACKHDVINKTGTTKRSMTPLKRNRDTAIDNNVMERNFGKVWTRGF